jgi:hypothetical protein
MAIKRILSVKFALGCQLFIAIAISCFSTTLVAQSLQSNDSVSRKTSWNVSLGSSVMGNQRSGVLFSTFIAPRVNYNINNKWSIGGGVIVSNYSLSNSRLLSNEKTGSTFPQNFTQSLLFVQGTYRASDRLTVNAMVYKSMDPGRTFGNQSQVNAFNSNLKGVMLDVNYKITENTSFNIGFNYSDGGSNPFMPQGSYGYNGFRNGNGGMFGW